MKEALWQQFGASIDMLENALLACPDELWDTASYSTIEHVTPAEQIRCAQLGIAHQSSFITPATTCSGF